MSEIIDRDYAYAIELFDRAETDSAVIVSIGQLLIAQLKQAHRNHEALLAALAEGFGPKPDLIAAVSPLCGHRGMAGGPGCVRRAGHGGGHSYSDGSGEQDRDVVKLAAMQDKDGDIWASLDGERWTMISAEYSESTEIVLGYDGKPISIIPLTS